MDKYQRIKEYWNEMASKNKPIPKLAIISQARKKSIDLIMQDMPDLDMWHGAITMVPSSDFNLGNNDRGWVANFDWLLRQNGNAIKYYELYINSKDDKQRLNELNNKFGAGV